MTDFTPTAAKSIKLLRDLADKEMRLGHHGEAAKLRLAAEWISVASEWISDQQPAPPAEGEVAELALYLRRVAPQNPMGIADERLNRAADLLERLSQQPAPSGYIDPEHVGRDQEMLEVFYSACRSEGGTADEITLRGLCAVLARWGVAHA